MMDANEFVTKLKANNTVTDITDLAKVFDDYKVILSQIATKDRAPFSLNVLCVLCRNLDKAPKWRDSIDNKELLTLGVECARETRAMERADRVKTLACLYHIHKHVVKQNAPVPPELALKISYMPFEVDSKHLLNEYSKTYWNILVDRLTYIERLRHKIAIVKLLPKLTEDFIKIIDIYETVQFCNNILVFLVKKMHLLYNDKHAKELNQTFAQIFQKLSMKDMKPFKALAHKELLEVYVKLNECLYIIAENSSKTNFKDSPLDSIVRTCLSIVGHSSDLFHCLQTFYSNSFCSLLTTNTHLNYSVTVLNGLVVSFEMAEKLGYSKAMLATYPFLNQFLRLYIEFNVNNCNKKRWQDNFNMQIQEPCLRLIQILIERLKYCDQLLKCENCDLKSGLHDSLRLSFHVKHFITVSLCQNIDISDILPLALDIIDNQYNILTELKDLGCVNYEKCFRKLQTDIHNTAISLNKAQYYEYSIKLFDVYLRFEIKQLTEQKNISRALYNKSICELDSKLYKSALIDAFLSLVFSDGLSSEKYMSLVMDIKAKELKSKTDKDNDDETKNEELQLLSLIDACKIALDSKMYGDIKQFLRNIKFCELLKHEFAMYAKLWPSVTPIAGVWRSLHDLAKGKYGVTVDEEVIWTLYEIVLETPSVVRAVSDEHFKQVIFELIEELDGKTLSTDCKVVYASLLLLKAEFDLAAASQKYGWKTTEPLQNLDPDQIPANRTIPQEYAASKSAVHAVEILSELSHDFETVSLTKCLEHSLQIYQVYVQQLLQLARDVEGLQLAYICCLIADFIGNDEAYVTNAGILLYHGTKCEELDGILKLAGEKCKGVAAETSILLMCDASMYYSRCGSFGPAAKFAELALARILSAYEMDPEINLDLAVGRLLEALVQLCLDSGPSTLSAVNGIQRHYLSVANTGTKWHTRRHRSLTLVLHTSVSSILACGACAGLGLRRRARAAASAALPRASAAHRAALYVLITDESAFDDAQIKIDNRLKHLLGLQPSNETQPYYAATETKKQEQFTPKQEIETMLDNMFFKKSQISPSIPCTSVPAFKVPDFFNHSSKCECYACNIPVCYLLACHTNGLEASMYFRANENEIARNYFNGILKMFTYIEGSFKNVKKRYSDVYTDFVVESVMKNYWERFKRVKIGILIELSFFELKCNDSDVADEHIVEIHETLQELGMVNKYMMNDVMNLMTCSAQMRKSIKKQDDIESLELDFDSLKLTPDKYAEPPKTPITKLSKPPTAPKVIVKDEELPKKRKVIKLNLDDGSSDEKEPKAASRKHEFKIPVPVTKHVLEAATPRNSKPKILLTQPSQETPNATLEFYTPKEKTPEQFFTPMTSVKTYKSLRRNIVKNLEQEFSTPIQSKEIEKKNTDNEKENTKANLELPSRSRKKVVKSILKRATSPGKLCKEKELPRNRRLRKPLSYDADDDDRR